MPGTKGELITIKVSTVIEWKVGCCFSGLGAGMCPNKMAGCSAFLVVTVGVASLDFKGRFRAHIGLSQMWNGKRENTVITASNFTQWWIDRKRSLRSSSHALECVAPRRVWIPDCVFCIWLWVCVHWCGSLYRWRCSARHFYQLVNSYLCSPHKHNCTSVCKRACLQWESGTVIKKERFVCMHEHMCLRAFLCKGLESRLSAIVAYGVHPGDEPVSSMGCICVGVWV